MGFEGAVEAQVDGAHYDVVHELGGLGYVCEPFYTLGSGAADREEAEEWEDHGDAEAVDWDAGAGGLLEEAGGVTIEGERVERTGCAVDV